MTHPSKRKGNDFERELVNEAREIGVVAKRAYASNGQSLGYHETVDIVVGGHRVQCKRRKKISNEYAVTEHVDAVAIREDRGETYVLVRWSDWLASRAIINESVRAEILEACVDSRDFDELYRRCIEAIG